MTRIHHGWTIAISLKSQDKAEKSSQPGYKGINPITRLWQPSMGNYSPLISEHITALLMQIPEDWGVFGDTGSLQNAFIDILITISALDADQGGCEFDLDPDVLAKLARTGLPVRVTVDCIEIGSRDMIPSSPTITNGFGTAFPPIGPNGVDDIGARQSGPG